MHMYKIICLYNYTYISSSSSVTDNPTLALFVLSDTYGKKCKKTKRKKQCKKKGKK